MNKNKYELLTCRQQQQQQQERQQQQQQQQQERQIRKSFFQKKKRSKMYNHTLRVNDSQDERRHSSQKTQKKRCHKRFQTVPQVGKFTSLNQTYSYEKILVDQEKKNHLGGPYILMYFFVLFSCL